MMAISCKKGKGECTGCGGCKELIYCCNCDGTIDTNDKYYKYLDDYYCENCKEVILEDLEC